MLFTHEQADVVDIEDPLIVVQAGAGAGKTTVLAHRAAARPARKMLMLVYTKAMQLSAEQRFPANVTCLTTHGLAYPAFGRKYEQAGKLGNIKPKDVSEALGINIRAARFVLKTVENFFCSGEFGFNLAMVPNEPGLNRDEVCALSEKLWGLMKDLKSEVPMTYDGYLKLFHLSQPDLSKQYHDILLDEAQDSNALTLDLVLGQKCNRVVVGDTHQSIFAFRGAMNALESIEGGVRLNLTHSFRFGSGVAAVATILLAAMKGETTPIVGRGEHRATHFDVDRNYRYAHISRTNAEVFSNAAELLGIKKLHFVGGVKSYPFEKIHDVYKLSVGQTGEIRDKFIKSFGAMHKLQEYAEEADDRELKIMLQLLKKYGSEIPELIKRIYAEAVEREELADVTLTTAHKAKGLEFEQVILSNDFDELLDEQGQLRSIVDEPELIQEVNLLYVALTRATAALQLNSQLQGLLATLEAEEYRVDLGPTEEEIDAMPLVTPAMLAAKGGQPQLMVQPEAVGHALPAVNLTDEVICDAILREGALTVDAVAKALGADRGTCRDWILSMMEEGRLHPGLFERDKELQAALRGDVVRNHPVPRAA